MKVKIYVLIDPITCKIRYIGRTKNTLEKRLLGHLSKSKLKNTHKDYWIQSLLKQGILPKIKLIKTVEGWGNSHQKEQIFIRTAIKYGFDLVNHDDRGEGSKNKIISDKQKQQISSTLREGYSCGRIKPVRVTSVSVFDLEGNVLNKFSSCKECVINLGIPQSSLENILSKRVRRWKNYQITYGKNPGIYIGRRRYNQNNREVFIYINKKELHFDSYKSAAKYMNVSSPTIRRNINKLYKGLFYITNARLKSDKLLENSEEDNQQPIISLND